MVLVSGTFFPPSAPVTTCPQMQIIAVLKGSWRRKVLLHEFSDCNTNAEVCCRLQAE